VAGRDDRKYQKLQRTNWSALVTTTVQCQQITQLTGSAIAI